MCPPPPGRVPLPSQRGPGQVGGHRGLGAEPAWGSRRRLRGPEKQEGVGVVALSPGWGGPGSSTAQRSRETGVRPRARPSPRRLVPTHHHQNPEEGLEVAGLGRLQLEELHVDDGEHDHEKPLSGEGRSRLWGRVPGGLGCTVRVPEALTVVTRPSRMRAAGRWGPRPQTRLDPQRVLFTKTGDMVPVPKWGALYVSQKARLDRSRGR